MQNRTKSLNHYLGYLLIFLIAYYPLFHALGSLPIVLWDESRLANNAFEMYTSNNWLVMQYDGQPDYWNAKPPLMIWLQVISMKLFGMTEFAIRFPSAMAGLFTCFLFYWFFGKKLGKPILGILAGAVMVTSVGYVKVHTARTGDFDTLLTLFTTAYGIFFYLYLDEKKKKYLYITFLAMAGAVMTKGIAGMILFPAFLFYALYKKEVINLLKSPHFYAGITIFISIILGFYFLRNHYDPGYIDAMIENEITDRFFREGKDANNDFWYYFNFMKIKDFKWWLWFIPVGAVYGILARNKKVKDASLLAVFFALTQILVVSKSGGKNEWYAMPSYPYFSILAALALYMLVQAIRDRQLASKPVLNAISAVIIILIFIPPFLTIRERKLHTDTYITVEDHMNMGYYMRGIMKDENIKNVIVAHKEYQADILWYVKVLNHQNRSVSTIHVDQLEVTDKTVVAYEEEAKKIIEDNFEFSKKDDYKNVTLYYLHGRK